MASISIASEIRVYKLNFQGLDLTVHIPTSILTFCSLNRIINQGLFIAFRFLYPVSSSVPKLFLKTSSKDF